MFICTMNNVKGHRSVCRTLLPAADEEGEPPVATRRQDAIREALRTLVPLAPFSDFDPIYTRAIGPGFRHLPPSTAAWLAVTAHVRHAHTDYDALLAEGYERDAARFFVKDAMEDQLTAWGCRRSIGESEEE
jgi:hypothetical protein